MTIHRGAAFRGLSGHDQARPPPACQPGFADPFRGAGLANIIPIIFSASAAAGPTSAEGISGSASLGYLGFLAGAPLIGAISAATSLTFGFALVVGLLAVVAAGASLLNPRPTTEPVPA